MGNRIIRCLSCLEERPNEGRNLCTTCYNRAKWNGEHTRYPACGAVPVPYRQRPWTNHPEPWPAKYTAEACGRMFWRDREGRVIDSNRTMGARWDFRAETRRDEQRAARWLATHPHQTAAWDDPALALFPAHAERRAA